jgi:cell division protein ZapA
VERLVTFKVLGQEYPLYTDAPEKDVQEILALVKTQLENAGQASQHVLPASKLGILTSLNIASKYVKMKKEYEEYKQQVEVKIALLSEKIEKNVR